MKGKVDVKELKVKEKKTYGLRFWTRFAIRNISSTSTIVGFLNMYFYLVIQKGVGSTDRRLDID
jgi:hypothetical protein